MKKYILTIVILLTGLCSLAQPTGYYNSTEGKDGEELKAALNDIISGHKEWSYFSSKYTFRVSDVDPGNPTNLILVYTGRSQSYDDFGSNPNDINREHVWAKSHGNFVDVMPMDGDVHNLKPVDASVNQDKSNKDYDWGGTQHSEATGCKYTEYTWEPRDEVKGDIARIIFYMSTRYEGENGESDLEVVERINTYPDPEHGRLSALLEWNLMDPPDDFEMNRNNVIFSYQKNRNPFIDYPYYAELIWGEESANPISIADVMIDPVEPEANEPVIVSASVTSSQANISKVELMFGGAWNNLPNNLDMNVNGDEYSATIPGVEEGEHVYYRIMATDGSDTNYTPVYNYYIPEVFTGTLISIYDIQGQTSESPYKGQVVSTSGIVTGNFGESYFIQNGYGEWNGLFIYERGRNPDIGDSVIITGTIDEYKEKTELKDVVGFYTISKGNTLPEPVLMVASGAQEPLESVLVKIHGATCTDDNYQADFYMWKVNDGTGDLKIHNTAVFEYEPTKGMAYDITGPLHYDYDEWKIELRSSDDVRESEDITGPEVSAVEVVTSTNIKVEFSEDLDENTAQDPSNYAIDNDVSITEVNLHPLVRNWVFLVVSALTEGDYNISIENVKDLSGNVMDPAVVPFSVVGIGERMGNHGISMFPNPAQNTLNINIDRYGNVQSILTIQDLSGRILLEEHMNISNGEDRYSVNLNSLTPGVYIIRLNGESTNAAGMFIKR